jgi:hypothetical protein
MGKDNKAVFAKHVESTSLRAALREAHGQLVMAETTNETKGARLIPKVPAPFNGEVHAVLLRESATPDVPVAVFTWADQAARWARDTFHVFGTPKDRLPPGVEVVPIPHDPSPEPEDAVQRVRDLERERDAALARVQELETWTRSVATRLAGCERWDGSFGEQRFVGCSLHRSDDPNECCIGCEAQALVEGRVVLPRER